MCLLLLAVLLLSEPGAAAAAEVCEFVEEKRRGGKVRKGQMATKKTRLTFPLSSYSPSWEAFDFTFRLFQEKQRCTIYAAAPK